MADEEDDELGPVGSMALGGLLVVIGLWMFTNGSGWCVTFVGMNSCVISGTLAGIIATIIGGILLLGGYFQWQEEREQRSGGYHPQQGAQHPGQMNRQGVGQQAPQNRQVPGNQQGKQAPPIQQPQQRPPPNQNQGQPPGSPNQHQTPQRNQQNHPQNQQNQPQNQQGYQPQRGGRQQPPNRQPRQQGQPNQQSPSHGQQNPQNPPQNRQPDRQQGRGNQPHEQHRPDQNESDTRDERESGDTERS